MAGTLSRFLALVGRTRTATGVVVATLAAGTTPPVTSSVLTTALTHQIADEPSRRRSLERWLLSVLPRPQIAPQAGHGSHSSHSSHASHASGTGHGSHYSGSHASHSSHASHYSSESHSSHSSHYSGYTTTAPTAAAAVPIAHTITLKVTFWDRKSGRLIGVDSKYMLYRIDILDKTIVYSGLDVHNAYEWRGLELHEFMMPILVDSSVIVEWQTALDGALQATTLRLLPSK